MDGIRGGYDGSCPCVARAPARRELRLVPLTGRDCGSSIPAVPRREVYVAFRFLSGCVALLASVGVMLAASDAHATVVVPLSLADQVQRADLIVRATVGEQQSAFVAERGAIMTWSTLR